MSTIMEALGGQGGQTIMEVLGGEKGETIAEVIEEKGVDVPPVKTTPTVVTNSDESDDPSKI
jgi:hypothetical protein